MNKTNMEKIKFNNLLAKIKIIKKRIYIMKNKI